MIAQARRRRKAGRDPLRRRGPCVIMGGDEIPGDRPGPPRRRASLVRGDAPGGSLPYRSQASGGPVPPVGIRTPVLFDDRLRAPPREGAPPLPEARPDAMGFPGARGADLPLQGRPHPLLYPGGKTAHPEPGLGRPVGIRDPGPPLGAEEPHGRLCRRRKPVPDRGRERRPGPADPEGRRGSSPTSSSRRTLRPGSSGRPSSSTGPATSRSSASAASRSTPGSPRTSSTWRSPRGPRSSRTTPPWRG